MNRFLIGLVLLLAVEHVSAAPPVVNYFTPSGGQRGQTVQVTVNGTFTKWPVQIWASDATIKAECSPTKGVLKVTIAPDAIPRVYWLRFADDEGASGLRPFIVSNLPEIAEKEPNDEVAKSMPIIGSAVINGKLDKSGDVDGYAVTLKKGETLVASLVAQQTLKSPIDAIMQITTAEGTVLEQNNDYLGLDPHVVYTARYEGTHVVRVFAFPSMPDSSIRFFGSDSAIYRLTLTTAGYVNHVLPLAVTDGTKTEMRLAGWNIAPNVQTQRITPSRDRSSLFVPTLANAVPLLIESHPCHDVDQRPTMFNAPCSITGWLKQREQRDVFKFVGKKGQALQFRVDSTELGLGVTPVLRLLDPAGKMLLRVEPTAINKDVTTRYTPTVDGELHVEVSDLYQQAGFRSVYRLRVTLTEPDYEMTVANDRFAVPLDKPLDIPVTINRLNGFTAPITLRVDGLPMGMTADVVPPAGKGDGKTMTLRVSAKKAGIGGAITIVGLVKDQPALTRTVTASVAELESSTTHLWINAGGSVPPAKKPKKR